MSSSQHFQIGNTYDFNVYGSGFLGNYRNVKVEGIVSHTQASQVSDIFSRHYQVYGLLPPDTVPNDAKAYYYLIVKMSSGELQAVGLPWIITDSIQLKGSLTAKVIIHNVNAHSADDIRQALSANGFSATTVTIE